MLTKNHAELELQVKAHVAADAVIQGDYWKEASNDVGGKGCFIGCLAHSSDASAVEDIFGLPLPLVKIAEGIFERLPADEARAFFSALPAAVDRDGKDLSRIHWKFLASELRALPAVPSHIQDVIDPVIAGIDLLASGDEWQRDAAARAAYAAHDAARAAYAAHADAAYTEYAARAAAAAAAAAAADDASYTAAADASYTAAYTADANAAADAGAVAGARRRQANTFLQLISEAE